MLSFLVTLLIICLVVGLVYLVIQAIPMPPAIKQIALIVLLAVAGIYLILQLVPLAGGGAGLHLAH